MQKIQRCLHPGSKILNLYLKTTVNSERVTNESYIKVIPWVALYLICTQHIRIITVVETQYCFINLCLIHYAYIYGVFCWAQWLHFMPIILSVFERLRRQIRKLNVLYTECFSIILAVLFI